MKVFLAAPLFSEAERGFNSKIAKRLGEKGFEVWLAQEAPFIQQGTHKEKKTIFFLSVSFRYDLLIWNRARFVTVV